ncbi:hypothetical protein UFOVP338_32 [uncultured Caudovirales phage]|uniref:Uncharacterized protein n=1 Tax=uncultured Caudovirales phage TaxID=2100421 RepID=A0A6J5M688_9CAUD|nr:hypothetical protein UFOVP338_32 [uncultured Caudovirales phage]
MTRKLTDEQVKAIEALTKKGAIDSLKIEINKEVNILVQPRGLYSEPEKTLSVVVLPMGSNLPSNIFKTPDEAIAYAEHLLNQRYCWLPQNNGWIISGEVINLTNAGKLLELMYLAKQAGWDSIDWDNWYSATQNNRLVAFIGYPTLKQLEFGITIHPESPIWDAVKGVE